MVNVGDASYTLEERIILRSDFVTKLANNKSSTNLQETSKSCTQPCPALCIITYWL
jgi:hypothetical protein